MNTTRNLFEEVVARTGLASFIGPGAVERALATVGATREKATVADYRRALPHLRGRMAVYLRPDELNRCVASLHELIEG